MLGDCILSTIANPLVKNTSSKHIHFSDVPAI